MSFKNQSASTSRFGAKSDPRPVVNNRRNAPSLPEKAQPVAPEELPVEPDDLEGESDGDSEGDTEERQFKVVLQRQWNMLRMIMSHADGLTLEQLAAEFKVSEKTIKRDVKSLEYVFGPIKTRNEAHGRKRYFYDKLFISFALSLTHDELLSIYLAQNLTTSLRGTYFWDKLVSGSEKIKSVLPKRTVEYAERVAPFFYRFDPAEDRYSDQMKRLLNNVLVSMENSWALQIKYRSINSQRMKTYKIHPYSFVCWNSAIYLVGYCCRDKKTKIWKVDRLYDAETTTERFDRKGFDVKKYLARAIAPYVGETPIETVKIRFTGYAARIVTEEKLRMITKAVREPDGSIVVTMETETGRSFTRWILGFGSKAEILEPASLRQAFLNELGEVTQKYLEPKENAESQDD